MEKKERLKLVLPIILASLLAINTAAIVGQGGKTPAGEPTKINNSYIIQLEKKPTVEIAGEFQKEIKDIKSHKRGLSTQNIRERIKTAKKAKENALKLQKKQIRKEQKEIISQIEKTRDSRATRRYTNTINAIAVRNLSKNRLEEIKDNPGIKKIHPNLRYKPQLQNSTDHINAQKVWETTYNNTKLLGNNTTIGIIDTGVDYTHPDLGNCTTEEFLNHTCQKIPGGYDFGENDSDPMDNYGHGTHVASTAAGNGKLKGVAPGAEIYAYKVSDRDGFLPTSAIIDAIERSTDPDQDGNFSDHLDIISLSLGLSIQTAPSTISTWTAMKNAIEIGVTPIAAAGNKGPAGQTVGAPGVFPKVLTVGATAGKEGITYFSSRGAGAKQNRTDRYIKPEIVAPGYKICAAQWENAFLPSNTNCAGDDRHVAISGTSMATPHVSGAAAIVLQKHPELEPKELKFVLTTTATDLEKPLNTQGAGLLNLEKAVNASLAGNISTIDLYNQTNATVKLRNIRNQTIKARTHQNFKKGKWGEKDPEKYQPLKIKPKNFTLQPGQEKQLNITLERQETKPGNYQGMIELITNTTNHRIPTNFRIEKRLELNYSELLGTPMFTLAYRMETIPNQTEPEKIAVQTSTVENEKFNSPTIISKGVKGFGDLGVATGITVINNTVITTNSSIMKAYNTTPEIQWNNTYAADSFLEKGNITNNSKEQIIAGSKDGTLTAVHTKNGSTIWNKTFLKGFKEIKTHNLLGDKRDEIITRDENGKIRIHHPNGSQITERNLNTSNPSSTFTSYTSTYSETIGGYDSVEKTILIAANRKGTKDSTVDKRGRLIKLNLSNQSLGETVWEKNFSSAVLEPKKVNWSTGKYLIATVEGRTILLNRTGNIEWVESAGTRPKEIFVLENSTIILSRPYAFQYDQKGNLKGKTYINQTQWEKFNTYSAETSATPTDFLEAPGKELTVLEMDEPGEEALGRLNLLYTSHIYQKTYNLTKPSPGLKKPHIIEKNINSSIYWNQTLEITLKANTSYNLSTAWTDLPVKLEKISSEGNNTTWKKRTNLSKVPDPISFVGTRNLTLGIADNYSNTKTTEIETEIIETEKPQITEKESRKEIYPKENHSLNLTAKDNYNLSKAKITTNETGNWSNITTIEIQGKKAKISYTWDNNSIEPNTTVAWKAYVEDYYGNKKETDTTTFRTVTAKPNISGSLEVRDKLEIETELPTWVRINRTDPNWNHTFRTEEKNNSAENNPTDGIGEIKLHNYGNYTVKTFINNSTGTIDSYTENIMINVTEKPEKIAFVHEPKSFVMEEENITSTLVFNTTELDKAEIRIENSSWEKSKNLIRQLQNNTSKTGEPYNITTCKTSCPHPETNLSAPSPDIYNLTFNLTNPAGSTVEREKRKIYKTKKIKFNLTDLEGNSTEKEISLAVGEKNNPIWTKEINGNGTIEVPEIQPEGLNFTIGVKTGNDTSKKAIFNINTSVRDKTNITTEKLQKDVERGNKIIYDRLIAETDKKSNGSLIKAKKRYSEITDKEIRYKKNITLLGCRKFNKTNKSCDTGWEYANLKQNIRLTEGISLIGELDTGIEAMAIGETEYCGNGYCSQGENYTTCSEDCEKPEDDQEENQTEEQPPIVVDPEPEVSVNSTTIQIQQVKVNRTDPEKIEITEQDHIIKKIIIKSQEGEIETEITAKKGEKIEGSYKNRTELLEYQTYDITANKSETKLNITFTVEKSWIESKNVTKENISLFHLKDSEWEKVDTELMEEKEDKISYSAEIGSFSTYMVAAEKDLGPVCVEETIYAINNGECQKFQDNCSVPEDHKEIDTDCGEWNNKQTAVEEIKTVEDNITTDRAKEVLSDAREKYRRGNYTGAIQLVDEAVKVEEEEKKGPGILIILLAIIGIATAGTGGFFGYRIWRKRRAIQKVDKVGSILMDSIEHGRLLRKEEYFNLLDKARESAEKGNYEESEQKLRELKKVL